MNFTSFYYNCSPPYINSLDSNLETNIKDILEKLPKRQDKSHTITDIFWLLTSNGWSFSTIPPEVGSQPPDDLQLSITLDEIKKSNDPHLCITSAHIETHTKSDFAKLFGKQIAQIEIQFGSLERYGC